MDGRLVQVYIGVLLQSLDPVQVYIRVLQSLDPVQVYIGVLLQSLDPVQVYIGVLLQSLDLRYILESSSPRNPIPSSVYLYPLKINIDDAWSHPT